MDLDFEQPIVDLENQIAQRKAQTNEPSAEQAAALAHMEQECAAKKREIYSQLTPWQTVQVARHPNRPVIRDFMAGLFTDFIELHGDRRFGDDAGILGGFATLGKYRVMVIGHQKGKTTDENIHCNFGMPRPEGYRKALRLMRLAERFRLPIVSFVDTPGAYPGMDAEERGQAEAIARNLVVMAGLQTPIIVVVTGEGGSGGALGIAVGDVVMMLSNAVYSVISPEGCASILWRDGSKAADAATAMQVTAPALFKLKVIDEVIPEPDGGAHRDYPGTMAAVRQALTTHLKRLWHSSESRLIKRRFEKFARIGKP